MEETTDTTVFAAVRLAVRIAVDAPQSAGIGRAALRNLAEQDRPLFFEAAMAMLEELTESRRRAGAYIRICEQPEFLLELVRPERYSRARLVEICTRILRYEKRLDLRLARLLPGRYEDRWKLPPQTIVRVLDVLNEISVGPRLVLPLAHLTEHSDPQVAERAVVLMGRRIRNRAWPQRRLSSVDDNVRAGAVEALWGSDTAEARAAMWRGVNDASHQVVGNALFGLHLLGEAAVDELADGMIHDPRPPFRATAARLLGRIGKPQYAGFLEQAAHDGDPGVRLEARHALASLVEARHNTEAESTAAAEAPADVPPPGEFEAPEDDGDLNVFLDGQHTAAR